MVRLDINVLGNHRGCEAVTQFADFISQVPDEVLKKTEMHLSNNIALFKPAIYIGGIKFIVTDYHIVFPSENTPDALFNNEMLHGEKRKVLAVNPGDAVSCFKKAPAKPYYSFLIKAGLLQKIGEEMDFSGEIRFQNILNPFSAELYNIFKSFERELRRGDRLNLLTDSLEIQIAAMLLRSFNTNLKKRILRTPDVDSYISLASEYIETYFSSNITIEDICKEVHVSCYHFIRMFKQKTGMSPHHYLLHIRVEKAKEFLRLGRCSVAETAALCGFLSVSHFSSVFKKSTGLSPADYKIQYS